MKNPFKCGTLVDNEFFTDRVGELTEIQRTLDSENHLVLISPRRFVASNRNPPQNRQMATSTTFSAIKRLMKAGYIIRVTDYEIEDPFFKAWIVKSCL